MAHNESKQNSSRFGYKDVSGNILDTRLHEEILFAGVWLPAE
jgi:hypothetical protein